MKKLIAAFTLLPLLFSLVACQQKDVQIHNPINFYYPVAAEYRKASDRIIKAEIREGSGFEKNLLSFTDRYMSGAESPELLSVFPEDCYPVSICKNGTLVTIYMSPSFAKLTGIDLTLACTCLSATLMDFADIQTVNICVKDTRLDGKRTITMNRDSFSLLDESFLEEESPTNQ